MSQIQTDKCNKKGMDVEFLRSIIDNDLDFQKELFNIFTENAGRNMIKMQESTGETDYNSWYMAAHAFKGAAASIGAFILAQTLEYAQKHHEETKEQKEDLLKKIREQMNLVLEYINQELLP
jgi:HPt (histidine-containing phosphotransfer) domain-containing protein